MYWFLARLLVLVFSPLPVGARINRPDPAKNEWIFTCREWRSAYSLTRQIWADFKSLSPKSS